jgi:hypothetical protein
LERFRGHKLTYVDASSLVFLGQHRIPEVWGTDRDLALEGARVVPAGRSTMRRRAFQRGTLRSPRTP